MNLLYLIYFAILNFMLFALLTKKVELTFKMKGFLILLLAVLIIVHFTTSELSNSHFLHLNIFSLSILLFHFGSAFAIWVMIKTAPRFKDHITLIMFNFLRYYVIYSLVYIYQLISLFSQEVREYF